MTIDGDAGKASARRMGKTTISYVGGMSTEVSVVKLIDLKADKKISNKIYKYQPIYSGEIFEIEGELDQHEKDRVMNNLIWNCQVNGPMAKYYKAKASIEDGPISSNQRVSC